MIFDLFASLFVKFMKNSGLSFRIKFYLVENQFSVYYFRIFLFFLIIKNIEKIIENLK